MQKRTIIASLAVTAGLVLAGTTGAVAGSLIGSADIRDNSVRSIDLKDGRGVGQSDLKPGLAAKVNKAGQPGPQGPAGPAGQDGEDAQALPYGVGKVKVSRGGAAATAWATYSTTIGGPEGDTTSGTFRFTCNEAQAPCKVNVAAYSTADGVKVYPRVNILTQSLNGGPEVQCEYGDGPLSGVLTGTATDQPVHIGGSDDCGLNGPAGLVNEITVPAGYYDVTTTFAFIR